MKILATVLTALLALTALAQDLTKPITYTTAAKPLRLVLDDLSKQAGYKLQTTSDMEDEPLILRLQSVPLKDVMDRMADVFAADWVDHHGYLQLERSDEKIATIKERLFEQRVAAFRASIDERVKIEQGVKPLDSDEATSIVKEVVSVANLQHDNLPYGDRAFSLDSRYPSMRLCVKALAKMDPKELASIGNNRRVVFSARPTEIQRQLPDFGDDALPQFVRDSRTLYHAVDTLKPDLSFGMKGVMYDVGLMEEAQPVDYDPDNLIVGVVRKGQTITLDFNLYDANWVPRTEDEEPLGTPWRTFFNKREKDADLGAKAQRYGYHLGPVAEELAARIGHDSKELRPVSKSTMDVVLAPTTTDPLAIGTSDTLLIGAAKAGLDVIALPTDGAEASALKCARTGKTSLERFQASLEYTDMTMDTKDGWLVLKPVDPLAAAAERVPRQALQDYYKSAVTDGYVSLEAFAKLRYACSRDSDLDVPVLGTQVLLSDDEWFPLSQQNVDTMRFYGSLSEGEHETAKTEVLNYDLANLSKDQQEMVSCLVFDGVGYEFSDLKPDKVHPIFAPERTEALPTGLPSDTKITVEDRSTKAIFFQALSVSGSEYLSLPMDTSFAAREMLLQEHPELFPYEMPGKIEGWMLGGQRTLDVKVIAGDRYLTEDSYQEKGRPHGDPLSLQDFLASLPGDMKKDLENQMSKLLQELKKQPPSPNTAPATTSGVPPPRHQ